jgi:aminoglycoside phosphotransferase (APT) family kinase protein
VPLSKEPDAAGDMTRVAAVFQLGRPLAAPRAVAGGLLNRVWKLTMTRGSFAVKQVNREDSGPVFAQPFAAALQVERAALSAGVPMPRVVPALGSDHYLVEVPAAGNRPFLVRVHEWVEGKMLALGRDESALAWRAGGLVAQIHALRPPETIEMKVTLNVPGAARWTELRELGLGSQVWTSRLTRILPVLSELESLVLGARAEPHEIVLTHGDADQKNFLTMTGGRLVIVDWDTAGPGSAEHEIVTVALQWAGVNGGLPDRSIAHRVLEGYQAAGGTLRPPGPSSFAGFFADLLRWLEFNLRRSLLPDGHERSLAEREVALTLANLPRFASSIDDWSRLLAQRAPIARFHRLPAA